MHLGYNTQRDTKETSEEVVCGAGAGTAEIPGHPGNASQRVPLSSVGLGVQPVA